MQTNSDIQTIRHHRDPFARINRGTRRPQRKAAIARKSLFLILI